MSLSLPSRYAFSSGTSSTPVRISRRSNLCFAVSAVRPSRRDSRSFPQPILLRHVTSTRSNIEIVRDCRANASSISSSSIDDLEDANSDGFDLSSFISFAEALCIISSAAISVVIAVNYVVVGEIGKKVLSLGFVGLVGSVASGSWLRRRQWMRICKGTRGGEGTNLIRRLEKLEEDLKTSTTIVRVLSSHLEKLGIRFRVTRKALKEPISETAALAQKNSEATRVLAAQQETLEKELGEIQKVLLAMQDQQRKQLELILTIAKNAKLFESSGNKQQPNEQKKVNKAEEASTSKQILFQ
uniref:Transmembrane protein n=1 Tax=Noccaea caerulescens TaxID=107243 RepID=A0A1J3FT92_NOCCA